MTPLGWLLGYRARLLALSPQELKTLTFTVSNTISAAVSSVVSVYYVRSVPPPLWETTLVAVTGGLFGYVVARVLGPSVFVWHQRLGSFLQRAFPWWVTALIWLSLGVLCFAAF